jgi:uncharacterized surface anchored protein
MIIRVVVLLCFTCITFLSPGDAQSRSSSCSKVDYENHNQVDYGPLKMAVINGNAIDPSGAPVPNACVLLFTERGHNLVSKMETDNDGQFKLNKIRKGHYRLVVKASGFCSANVPIIVTSEAEAKRLAVHMKMGEVDSCSYGDLK